MDNAAAMLVVKDVVQRILDSKENGTYDELLSGCKLNIAAFLKSIHPKKDHLALLKKLEQFDKLPGSYQISSFLACYNGVGGFNLAPTVSKPPTSNRPRCQLFPPLLPRSKGIEPKPEFFIRIGLDYRAYLKILWGKDFEDDSIPVKITGRNIYDHWPADMVEAIYTKIDTSRPVLQRDLQSDEWWKAKGYMLLEHGIKTGFFALEDYTVKDHIIFPLRLLKSTPVLLDKHTAMKDEDSKSYEEVEDDCRLKTTDIKDSDDSDSREEDVHTEFSENSDIPEEDLSMKDPKCSDMSEQNLDALAHRESTEEVGEDNVDGTGADDFMEGLALDDLFGEW